MERKTKEIIFGAAIIISLVVIFIPYVLNGQLRIGDASSDIPSSPVWAEKHKLVPQPKEMANFKNQALKPHQTPLISDKSDTWVVSAGKYNTSQEAEKGLKILQEKKLPAYLKIDTSDSENIKYWVLVGPKLQKAEAQNIVKQLKQEKIDAELKTYHPNMALD